MAAIQDPMPQRDRRIMRRTRVYGWEAKDGTGEGGGGAEKSKKPQKKNYRRDIENGGDLGGRRKKERIDKGALVQQVPTENIKRIERKQKGKCKALSAQITTVA